MTQSNNQNKLNHIAIIMDGNGRWAKRQKKIRLSGHRAGLKSVKETVKAAHKHGVKFLTLFAFSSENWQRSEDEVKGLISLFTYALGKEAENLQKHNIRLNIIGDISKFPQKLQKQILMVEQLTEQNNDLILNIAANYGGRWDITQACKSIASDIKNNLLSINDISEQLFNRYIQLSDMPEIDLVIRTGGEQRISNFLLWQITYSELYFTDILWPDFNQHQFDLAVNSFYKRERRFGSI